MRARCSIKDCDKLVDTKGWCKAHYLRNLRHGNPLGGGPAPGSTRKILDAAAISTSDECIYLKGFKGRRYVNLGPKVMPAARAVWTIAHGDPGEWHVLHTCHGGSGAAGCININHLKLGTRADNMRDIAESGNWYKNRTYETIPRGEAAGNSKLTEKEVHEIKDLLRHGVMSGRAIARAYGVSDTPISHIRRGKTWLHVQ